jgi:hypothetical protein
MSVVTRVHLDDTDDMRWLRRLDWTILNPLTWPSRLIWMMVRRGL